MMLKILSMSGLLFFQQFFLALKMRPLHATIQYVPLFMGIGFVPLLSVFSVTFGKVS